MFLMKKLLSALILPPTGLLLLAFLGLWLTSRRPRLGNGITVFALLAIVALSLPLVSTSLKRSLEGNPPISAQQLAKAQAIVILGGGIYPNAPEYGGDSVSSGTLERVRYGAYLQRSSGVPILVTGGAPYGGRAEGDTMKEAIERDLHGHVEWVEGESRDTAENAVFSAAMLKKAGVSRIALVSHGWHLARAVELFQLQGMDVIPAPTGFTTPAPTLFPQFLPSAEALANSSLALHEWLGILVQRLTR